MNLHKRIAIQISLGVLFALALLTLGSGLAAENVGRGANYRYAVTIPAVSME